MEKKNFVTHLGEDTSGLVKRVTDGIGSSKIKQVDYEQLRALATQKRLDGQKKFFKVKKLEEVSKNSKEQNLLKQHRRAWHQEFSRQASQRRHLQADVDTHTSQAVLNTDTKKLYQELEEYEMRLESELRAFRKHTVQPIWTFRDDVQFYLQSNGDSDSSPKDVYEELKSVKKQQEKIIVQLNHAQKTVEEELDTDMISELSQPAERQVHTGIPPEAFDLSCPDDDLKASVLQEFIILDEKYLEKMENLRDKHQAAVSSRTGGWSKADHWVFQVVVDQYTHDIPNRRMLYIDRLLRHLPHHSRNSIVEHEDWWLQSRYLHERQRDLTHDWLRDRRELFNRAQVVFAEAELTKQLEETKEEHRQQQKELCDALYQRVTEWREQKLEALQLEQELAEARRRKQREMETAEREKEKKRRDVEKAKISSFQKKQEVERQAQEEENLRRLEELKQQLAEQAAHDKERVKFREEQFHEKQRRKQQRELEKEEEEIERQQRLEHLREQVRPQVEGDLLRLWSDTETWAQHVRGEEDLNLQQPLFTINTFHSKQVTNDGRVRLEGKLREAGLLNTDYARQMIQQMAPPQQPRKDMESTVFKHL